VSAGVTRYDVCDDGLTGFHPSISLGIRCLSVPSAWRARRRRHEFDIDLGIVDGVVRDFDAIALPEGMAARIE
jgi:hypothetical protein